MDYGRISMADPTTFPEEHVREPLVYRHISGFAIASLIVACSYAAIVLVLCIAGVARSMPVLLSPWVQFLAVIGAGLALAALVQVRRSEDTVAGGKLALWGLLISVFFGLGYGAYYAATYFAIRHQADTFTERWLQKLAQAKINHAFLDTQDPANRQHVNPEDEDALNARFPAPMARALVNRSPLDSFRENKLVHVVVQGGPATRVTPLGLKDWEYRNGGYQVIRTYRLETEEGAFEAQITAVGSVSKTREFEGREWRIVPGGTQLQLEELSPRAKEILVLREQSSQFLEEWGNKLISGRLEEAYLDTREPAERAALAREFDRRRAALPVLALGLAAIDPWAGPWFVLWAASPDFNELARQLFLPGYTDLFHRHGILQTDKFRAGDVETKDQILSALKGLFGPVRAEDAHLLSLKPGLGSGFQVWKVERDRLQLPHDCRLSIAEAGKFRYAALATITVESDPGPVTASRKPIWRIRSMEPMSGEDVTRRAPGPGPGFN
jgi:hypothetical protein